MSAGILTSLKNTGQRFWKPETKKSPAEIPAGDLPIQLAANLIQHFAVISHVLNQVLHDFHIQYTSK